MLAPLASGAPAAAEGKEVGKEVGKEGGKAGSGKQWIPKEIKQPLS